MGTNRVGAGVSVNRAPIFKFILFAKKNCFPQKLLAVSISNRGGFVIKEEGECDLDSGQDLCRTYSWNLSILNLF
jgi:hypothetical protein